MEQALPLRADWLNFNRFRARAEHTVPMGPYRLLLCGKGAWPSCHLEGCPETGVPAVCFR